MKIAECRKKDLNLQFTDDDDLRRKLTKIYTVDGHVPVINMKGDVIEVWIEDCVYIPVADDYNRAAALCNINDYDKAEPILLDIIQRCPIHVESFRILGQIEYERGNYDKAVDYTLSALVLNPTHLWSLILMGNICAKKGDFETAKIYYGKALEYNQDNIQVLNNVGAVYMRNGKYDEANDLFKKVLQKDSTYINSYLGLAMSYRQQGKFQESISTCIDGLRKGKSLPQDKNLEESLKDELIQSSKCFVSDFDYNIEIEMQKKKLEEMTNIPLLVEADENLKIHAKMEYYIAHDKNYNRVVFNPNKLFKAHMLMHEFTHLEMYLKASKGRQEYVYCRRSSGKDCVRQMVVS